MNRTHALICIAISNIWVATMPGLSAENHIVVAGVWLVMAILYQVLDAI